VLTVLSGGAVGVGDVEWRPMFPPFGIPTHNQPPPDMKGTLPFTTNSPTALHKQPPVEGTPLQGQPPPVGATIESLSGILLLDVQPPGAVVPSRDQNGVLPTGSAVHTHLGTPAAGGSTAENADDILARLLDEVTEVPEETSSRSLGAHVAMELDTDLAVFV
jgi:hypothetical protein